MAYLEGLPEEIFLFSLKRTWQHSFGLQSYINTNHKTSGTMSFGQTRPKWRCLVIVHSTTSGENQKQHISRNYPCLYPSTEGCRCFEREICVHSCSMQNFSSSTVCGCSCLILLITKSPFTQVSNVHELMFSPSGCCGD